MRFKKFETYEEQRDYTANKLQASPYKLRELAGRIALTVPLPPNIKSEPFAMYGSGIKTEASWNFADHTHSEDFQGEKLARHAATILYIGKRAGQLLVTAYFDERTRESRKKLRFYADTRGTIEVSNSEGLSDQKEKDLFIESFVEDMELRILSYDTPASAQRDRSFLDYMDNEYRGNEHYEPYLKVIHEVYEEGMESSIKTHRQEYGIPESGDPTM
jgi:hypothetical protein